MPLVINHSAYLNKVYQPVVFAQTVHKVATAILAFRKDNPFDAIAFSGSSGASVAYPVGFLLGIPLIYVRKENEKSHGRGVEGTEGNIDSYVIIDDFIASGSTVRHIIKSLNGADCRRIFVYSAAAGSDYSTEFGDIPVEMVG